MNKSQLARVMNRSRRAESDFRKEQDATQSSVDTNRKSTPGISSDQRKEGTDEENFESDDLLGDYEEFD